MVEERVEEVVMEENTTLDKPKKNKFLAAGIISIILTVIATVGAFICIWFFADFFKSLNTEVPEGETDLSGLGRGFLLVFYIIFGAIGAVVALIASIVSILAVKWKKIPGFLLLFLNVAYIIMEIAFFVIMVNSNNAAN